MDINTTPIYLNTTPCQFSVSKTKNAINFINELDASRCEPNSENGVHHMTIILTNNSLIEGRQWNIRLNDSNKLRNVAILSSDRKRARFHDADNFLGYCTSINKPDDLIDTLVVCNNFIRNFDIKKIINISDDGRINLGKIGINKFKFTVMFDEVDVPSNLSNACEFIDNYKKNSCIHSIHLITATAYEKFWKKLKQQGINKLKNLRAEISEIMSPYESIESYKKIQDHNIIYVESEFESDDFIKDIFQKYISKNEYPMRLFAPPSKKTNTHDEIKNFFLKKGFIIVLINGKSKDIFLPKEKISINDFNRIHFPKNPDVEMYKTLTKLNKLYKNTNIVITGFNCIERGITFQTKGFNFTDMIIPPIKDISTCVQLIGRANGGKEYVHRHNIYIQKEQYTNVEKRVNFALRLIESNPIEINEKDFREKTAKEKDMIRWEIPISIDLTNEQFDYIVEKNGIKFIRDRTWSLFKEKNINIDGYESAMWNYPNVNISAYNKNIIPLLNAIRSNEKICLLHKKYKNKNKKIYSVYFDGKNKKVILVKYNGNIETK